MKQPSAEWPRSVSIHPSAIVAPEAQLGENVQIGPWCSVGPDVVLGKNVRLHSSVVIDGITVLGDGVEIYPFVTVGMAPQDLKYRGEPTRCEIGERTVLRENVTIHRGTAQGDGITRVGAHCLVMANAHVAHDCVIGDGVIIVNNVVMGGHVEIGDGARIMGAAALHQFVRIGRGALVGGVCGVESDVIPYGSVLGNRARLVGLHWIWLRRQGVEAPEIQAMRRAFRILYPRQGGDGAVLESRLAEVKRDFADIPRVQEIVAFMEAPSRRGLVRAIRPSAVTSETEGA
ncbi:acyl-ACP--UDP-N-acetylglucosamine O-acyltransferase [Kozakia baliensis]|uniref:Acyl-[acyl-carrier-protein]--UDP-N-acetylglucosamine O-acyltransferase n=1 Tax=Kozakia baliensis TaxID=153496 RepID=A0A1D8URR0_9PROT|nr:acyl-ACP--UDP-N-acetylglucosamine O-acyltransferase [Kozakia baliensis]AOX16321.1 acyl-[acyl-carrier-protein]--UDP-N-acetylglucosamine O-acyltransferase [Kozakia baliensis]GBR28609.1 UDP-N-acetylglucosamine acyltransferase [Kozakia baliensis NRIC 0488]GEL63618.1 acyl-[acyl-carrier-protein]--UDP-N-acetylglucosamine O-acyltransferase [Kozakia baliensis]